MLNLRKRNRQNNDVQIIDTRSILEANPDLQIRSLLDHPEVRRVMGLEVTELHSVVERRYDRRRLLADAAA